MVTVTLDAPQQSAFSFTYSKLSGFETCPLRYYETEVLKNWPEERNEYLEWGNAVHAAIEANLVRQEPLPASMRGYQKWIDKVAGTPGELLCEDSGRLAIDSAFKPCAWNSPSTWLRGIADVIKLDESYPGAALVVDWKTGKPSNADPVQLVILGLLAFIHFPKILRVRADFVFLASDARTTVVLDRAEMPVHWAELMPRVRVMQHAVETSEFPARPNRFCRNWCPVKTCAYNGR